MFTHPTFGPADATTFFPVPGLFVFPRSLIPESKERDENDKQKQTPFKRQKKLYKNEQNTNNCQGIVHHDFMYTILF